MFDSDGLATGVGAFGVAPAAQHFAAGWLAGCVLAGAACVALSGPVFPWSAFGAPLCPSQLPLLDWAMATTTQHSMKAAAMVNTHTHARLLRFIAILPIRNGREYSALPCRTAIRIYRNPCPIIADALDCCWQSMLEFAPAFGALRVLDFLRRVFLLWPQKASCKIKKGLRFLG